MISRCMGLGSGVGFAELKRVPPARHHECRPRASVSWPATLAASPGRNPEPSIARRGRAPARTSVGYAKLGGGNPPVITPENERQAGSVVELQLEKAGVRQAHSLMRTCNEALVSRTFPDLRSRVDCLLNGWSLLRAGGSQEQTSHRRGASSSAPNTFIPTQDSKAALHYTWLRSTLGVLLRALFSSLSL